MARFGSPFYREVDAAVKGELNNRKTIYSRRVRSGNATGSDLAFSYKKTAWAYAKAAGGTQVGGYSRQVISNASGQLSLYQSATNKPAIPILNSVEISNEGMLGSLVKAKINFTVWPDLSSGGMGGSVFNSLLNAYANPGNELEIDWGWSERGTGPNRGDFDGIIHNFNWSVNTDLSVTFDISAVGKGSISTGFTGEQSNPDPPAGATANVKDPAGNVIPNSDIAAIMKQDMTAFSTANPNFTAPVGTAVWMPTPPPNQRTGTGGGPLFQYVGIALPRGEDDTATPSSGGTGGAPTGPRPVDIIWYVAIGNVIDVLDYLMGQAFSQKPFKIKAFDSFTDSHTEIASANPEEVYFPDAINGMGTYGTINPFSGKTAPNQNWTFNKTGTCKAFNGAGIGPTAILLSVPLVQKTFKKFVQDNQTNLETKNFTKFIDDLVKCANYASGEVYQLSTVITEPQRGAGAAEVTIEDNNLPIGISSCVIPYPIEASTYAPIIKSVQISSKPPNLAAASEFVRGRGKVSPTDAKSENTSSPGSASSDALKDINDLKNTFLTRGYGPSFTKDMKAAITKWKKSTGGKNWTNKPIYPVDLSITIDGITGFKFGDVITTNLIPTSYRKELVFTVTKIIHTIKDGTWETTLQTKARKLV